MPRSRKRGSIHPLPHTSSGVVFYVLSTGTTLTFTIIIIIVIIIFIIIIITTTTIWDKQTVVKRDKFL
jgi:hypothetical protein